MNSKTGLAFFRKINGGTQDYKLREHIDETIDNYVEYYCANIVEKRFNCSNQLTYVKSGGFGRNYKYCSDCYEKWNKLQAIIPQSNYKKRGQKV